MIVNRTNKLIFLALPVSSFNSGTVNQLAMLARGPHAPLMHIRLQYSRSICSFDSSDFPEQWPYDDNTDFGRVDKSDDSSFYSQPRYVTHIDDRAIESLTEYYQEVFEEVGKKKASSSGVEGVASLDILDTCSSWISHLPEASSSFKYNRVSGVGMNQSELSQNNQLTEYFVHDLNKEPSFSEYFEDESFDVVTNVVSIDYLTRPVDVMQEMHRVLRPGGVALISFSNRCFPTKAISMWLRSDDVDRLAIVASYFHFSNKGWTDIEALDIKLPPVEMPKRPGWGEIMQDSTKAFAWASTAGAVAKANSGDPMFVVKAMKTM
mmetsp:Transcript_29790/g.62657  ORF Transcript_29790/g.62657 Transcript_29790/m.62657 type:complete len:321 (-) Transcript_29790:499-1461(-)